jgi:hypothetical protein
MSIGEWRTPEGALCDAGALSVAGGEEIDADQRSDMRVGATRGDEQTEDRVKTRRGQCLLQAAAGGAKLGRATSISFNDWLGLVGVV